MLNLFQKYLDLREDGLKDVLIERLLEVYCDSKNQVQRAVNSLKAPQYLDGNYTFTFGDLELERAKEQAKERMAKFHLLRQLYIGTSMNEKRARPFDIKYFYRIAAFVVSSALALSIQHLLQLYYRVEGGDEMEEELREANIRVELMQATAMFCSLASIIVILYEEENK